MTVRIGLIGAGRIGRVHAEHLANRIPEANLVAVSDIFVEAAEKLASDFQIPAAYKDHRRIMEDKTIEAVVICSSTDTHAMMIAEAATAGKHIFCEKPIIAVKIPGFDLKYAQQLCRGGIPFFDSAERAVHTYALVVRYQNWLKKQF